MPIGILFWVLYVVCFVFSAWVAMPWGRAAGPSLAIFILIGLLGWGTFGPLLNG